MVHSLKPAIITDGIH
jgi:hypothetical protein